ncbi:agmatine deiminase family protein [Nocardioides jiangxiensis]|uniref:Agmatine deiminase family protein n=1 Tax=Nocardioides jiangxiensis TaxID=3064524 RepID=A0ABT9B4L7_9ACTN|nr:agmatine deiminase family protein [Nocardioides sp. WY-20]MDO7868246.1 agmatine deiminase family protein [Nocardioides sp. WY-20]
MFEYRSNRQYVQPNRLMPAETAPHEAAWMAWPSGSYTLGERPADADEARSTWAAVANAIVEFEPVHVLVPPSERAEAARFLDPRVRVHERMLDDAWYRDIGPTFVIEGEGPTRSLGAVTWVFNGWGQQEWARWEHDAVASHVAVDATGATRIDSPMVNEGGGIHTNGAGTFLVTETVQLDPDRNPGWTRADVEAELARTLGARKVIWLPRGLTRDSERFGTRGHVDIVATFADRGVVLVHDQRDPAHPDHEVSRELIELLEAERDADGKPLRVVRLPAPATLRDDEGWVDYSYVNHFVCNGAVIACSFDDPVDGEALAVLADAYPGRRVVAIDARPLFARGGGIHCITQQQPLLHP